MTSALLPISKNKQGMCTYVCVYNAPPSVNFAEDGSIFMPVFKFALNNDTGLDPPLVYCQILIFVFDEFVSGKQVVRNCG